MAFNPFEAFRKNSKVLIALLTIFVMFIFVLSSGIGGGDFFDWLTVQCGGKEGRNPVYGEIDGKNYRSDQLDEIRRLRGAANLFMLNAVEQCDHALISLIQQDLKNNLIRNQDVQRDLGQVERDRASIISFGATIRPRTFEFVSGEQLSAELYARAAQLNERDSAAEIRNLRRAAKLLDHAAVLFSVRATGGLFFFEVPNQNGLDAFRYLMLLKEADRMDLRFTDDDVKKLINDETEGVLNDDKTAREVDNAVRKEYKFSSDKVLKAIGDEYRMRTAMTILRGRLTTPAAQTPFEMFEFFKDQCMRARFETVALSIEKYLPLVKKEPTKEELAALYDQYARVEYDPEKSTPGFKEPRRVKIEYIGLDNTLPLYKQGGPFVEAATKVAFPLQSIAGGDPISLALLTASPLLTESLVVREALERDPHIASLRMERLFSLCRHGVPEVPKALGVNAVDDTLTLVRLLTYLRTANRFIDPFPKPAGQLLYQPLPLASLTAQLAVANNPLAATAGAVTAMQNTTRLLDVRLRVAAGLQAAVTPLSPNPAFSITSAFASSAAALANLPTLPEAFWTALYYEQQRETKAVERRYALRDFNRLQERLSEIRKRLAPPEEKKDITAVTPRKKDKFKPKDEDVKKANDDARALIDQFIKDHTFKDRPSVRTGTSEKLRDQFDAHNDSGLKPLHDKLVDSLKQRAREQSNRELYGAFQAAFFPPLDAKDNPLVGLFAPVEFPQQRVTAEDFDKPVYLAWRTEDVPAKQVPYPQISEEMKAKVVRAWKIRKARELAMEDAQRVAESLRALGKKHLVDSDNAAAFDKDLTELVDKDNKWQKLLASISVSMLTYHPAMQFNARPSFMPPAVRNPQIQYPLSSPDRDGDRWNGRRMAYQLLEVRNKPLGETVITKDEPEMHIYVSVMVEKTPPNMETFFDTFKQMRTGDSGLSPDNFYGPFRQKGFGELRDDVYNRIKAEAKFKETDALKKSLEKKGEGSSE